MGAVSSTVRWGAVGTGVAVGLRRTVGRGVGLGVGFLVGVGVGVGLGLAVGVADTTAMTWPVGVRAPFDDATLVTQAAPINAARSR